ncbi:type IX secretion system PorP/SprF family membrane protein [Maribacter vaceletii]|uniref:Type IX secretion system PorP/SprF family membrane protein n=1 Tax=Maribacter vaceletii TaxID=1206816 RepID=A0A495EAZ7_9FLAO|nr:type IX secretion system membrane protein PorP/SprF [Maribacter vaceletii]RKR14030.1 type IX secretion system PorP/SprF family membrane protein [Maribacter vaceletii]
MKKTFLYFFFLLLLQSSFVVAQQDPQYTQYMYNMSVINPAYTTNNLNVVNFGTLYRSQWASAVGSPKTLTFFAHAAITEKVEAGISFIKDEIGDGALKENNVFADFAYSLKLDDQSRLALGLKAGITNFNTNFNGFMLPETQDDSAFSENMNSTFPNVGFGAFYHRDKLYAGLSIPNFLNSKHVDNQNGISTVGSEKMHLFATAGYVYDLNNNIKLKPSFLAKMVKGAPITFDVSLNTLIHNKFEAGISYRLEDAINAMFNMKILPGLKAGYAYDYTLSNLSDFSAGSHEIFLLFDLDLLGLQRGYDKSPRFY